MSTTATRDTQENATPSGEETLRRDPMMRNLLDALDKKTDIGHYGRLVFAIVARHFLSPEEVVSYLTKDKDFTQEAAQDLVSQVIDRGYNPPRREKILDYQSQQDFQIIPDPDDPDEGNVYRDLNFPDEVYQHISDYREHKTAAHDN